MSHVYVAIEEIEVADRDVGGHGTLSGDYIPLANTESFCIGDAKIRRYYIGEADVWICDFTPHFGNKLWIAKTKHGAEICGIFIQLI